MMSGHVAIEGVLVAAADAVLLAAPLDRAADKDAASRLLGALQENLELRDVSMDDRLAVVRALEECPGDMVELRAWLLSEPQPPSASAASTETARSLIRSRFARGPRCPPVPR